MFTTDRVDREDDDENVAALGLGELADLTVFNEADTSSYDVRIRSPLLVCLWHPDVMVCMGYMRRRVSMKGEVTCPSKVL